MHKIIKNYFDLYNNKNTTSSKLWSEAEEGLTKKDILQMLILKRGKI